MEQLLGNGKRYEEIPKGKGQRMKRERQRERDIKRKVAVMKRKIAE